MQQHQISDFGALGNFMVFSSVVVAAVTGGLGYWGLKLGRQHSWAYVLIIPALFFGVGSAFGAVFLLFVFLGGGHGSDPAIGLYIILGCSMPALVAGYLVRLWINEGKSGSTQA